MILLDFQLIKKIWVIQTGEQHCEVCLVKKHNKWKTILNECTWHFTTFSYLIFMTDDNHSRLMISLMTYSTYTTVLHTNFLQISFGSWTLCEYRKKQNKTQTLVISSSNQICQWTLCLIRLDLTSVAVYLSASCACRNSGSVQAKIWFLFVNPM